MLIICQSDTWRRRSSAVREHCERKPVLLDSKLNREQLVSNIVRIQGLNINWCLVPKVASSSVSQAVLPYLPHKTDGKVRNYSYIQAEIWDRAGHVEYEDFRSSQDMSPNFLISRHPLTRLASAYRNKLQPGTRMQQEFIQGYGEIISRTARGSWKAGDPDPTFQEFVKYLIKTPMQDLDEHWMSISLRCRVCQLNYDFILHYENLQSDWTKFLRDVNITKDIRLPWENRGAGDIDSYYQNISGEDMESLYQKYEADFLMFGYSIENIKNIIP